MLFSFFLVVVVAAAVVVVVMNVKIKEGKISVNERGSPLDANRLRYVASDTILKKKMSVDMYHCASFRRTTKQPRATTVGGLSDATSTNSPLKHERFALYLFFFTFLIKTLTL